jgi:NitT/TauT family transport system substrate-binding protein
VKKLALLILVIVAVGLGAFWLYSNKKNTTSKYSGPLEAVIVRLKWVHQAQFAGNYVAIEKGFYADEGLSVTVEPFSYEDRSIASVLAGKSDFGIAGAEEILLAKEAGLPIKAFAVIYKKNPVVAYSLKSSGITRPSQFVGKTVGIERGINVEYQYAAMMSKLGIDRSKIKEVSVGYDAAELLTGKVEVSTGYIINEPQLVVEAGKEINTMLMSDYGINMYADVLFTTDEMIAKRPELVAKMLRATLKGWQYAIEHEEEAVNITLKYAKDSTKIHQTSMLATSVPLINTGIGKLGFMEKAEWEQAQNIMFEQKILKKKIDVSEAYTMKFLEEMYK